MWLSRGTIFLSAAILIGAGALSLAPAQQSDLQAIVERDGTVVLCVLRGEILFADRCAGTGRLMIVQPIQEGPIVWRSVIGTIAMQNEAPQNPDCALSRAKWDPGAERAIASGKRIRNVDPAEVLARLNSITAREIENLEEGDVTAFELDLDNDGAVEIVFSADNVKRFADLYEKTKGTYPYVIRGEIFSGRFRNPSSFFFEEGEYRGGTDAIGRVLFKGIVPFAPGTGEIALLVRTDLGFDGIQTLVRFRGQVQRIEAIEFRCQ